LTLLGMPSDIYARSAWVMLIAGRQQNAISSRVSPKPRKGARRPLVDAAIEGRALRAADHDEPHSPS